MKLSYVIVYFVILIFLLLEVIFLNYNNLKIHLSLILKIMNYIL
jgi:hypothetical protein